MYMKNPKWIGGFKETNKEFAYPDPDLRCLPMLDNMTNIHKLRRQQKVEWPEFSWEVVCGNPETRCFQMFSPEISRIGYTSLGRVYSIICPQQGYCLDKVGTFNVEITVTGQRGWIDECQHQHHNKNEDKAADMTVVGKIWFGPSSHQQPIFSTLAKIAKTLDFHLPLTKEHAIAVTTHKVGQPDNPIFQVRGGETARFKLPKKADHSDTAWSVAHIEIEISDIEHTGDLVADSFNALIMFLFHIASGNILKKGSIVTWNVWFTAPEIVDEEEWQEHADFWRKSIEADHGAPTGEGIAPYYADGKPFHPKLHNRDIVEIVKNLTNLILEQEHDNAKTMSQFLIDHAYRWCHKIL